MRVKYGIGLLFVVVAQVFGQTVTTLNLSTQGHNPDFANFPFTRPISTGSAVPATCQLGQMFFNTAAVPGQNIYACTQTNTWTLLGAFTLLPAGPSTLGGVVVTGSSGLNINSNGLLSANVGTGPGTVAAGNDTRIVNALQPTSQIPATNITGLARSATTDTTSASNISTGTLNVTLFPSTINSNTTGNAATASSLAVVPRGCNTGQFSVGISATGTANCAQVAYAQLSGTPSMYNQSVQVAGSAQIQRTSLNFAAGSNLTITPSDNGSNTTTLTISGTGLQAPSTTNKLLKYTTGSSTTAAQASDVTSALGFTPQNVSGLNAPSGYAGLDANGLLLVSEMPPAINSNTSGKAATATALAAIPVVCAGGQFATGIGVNGNAICGTPTGGLPDPGTNGLVKRTGANTDAVASAGVDYYAPGTQINDLDLPNTITSSITGNASTATALAAAPTACGAGQVLAQILTNGNPATCVPSDYNTLLVNSVSQTQRAKLALNAGSNITITPADNGSDTTSLTIAATGGTGSGLPDPGVNGLVKRTAANTDTAAIAGTDYYAPGTAISDNDLPATISSNITGNAATATALKVSPSGCSAGQFVTQISANGTPTCGVAASGGPSITSGTTVPTVSGCSSLTKGSGYLQTGVAGGSSGSVLYICSTGPAGFNGGYAWVPQNGHHVSVMAFGAKADGSTDDSGAFNTAVSFASTLNKYTQFDGTNPYLGSDVYVPCGDYILGSPIVLPRVQPSGYPNGPNNGVVSIIGESPSCSVLQGNNGSGWNGVTGVFLTGTGSTYSGTPTVAFTGGGCSTEPAGAVVLQAGAAGNIGQVYLTATGSGCTSMPTCTIAGTGSGATCETLGHAMIEWASITPGTFVRASHGRIMNLQFKAPTVAGTMDIHYQASNTPVQSGCTIGQAEVCERLENQTFEHLRFADDDVYNPASIAISGDCILCSFKELMNDPAHPSTANYQTPLIITDYYISGSETADEGEGLEFADIDHISCGGGKGGSAPCFQGRMSRSAMSNADCDAIRTGVPNATCFAFYNSAAVVLSNLSNEGTAATQFLLQNSKDFWMKNTGIGSGIVTAGLPPPIGISLVGSSMNRFDMALSSPTNFFTNGGLRISVDSTSYQNQFFGFEINSTTEVSGISGTASNYMQYCLVSACNTNTAWSHMGTSPF